MKKTKKPTKKKVVKKISKKQVVSKELVVAEPKLAMSNSFVSERQLAFMLGRTPANHIYKRPAKGGGEWEYVTGTYVTKVLNYVFGWSWDFQIIDKGREGNLVWVQGRLTIRDKDGNVRIIKEQFGRADMKFKRGSQEALDYGNDLKSASTDALKKCASQLGIASDVYGKNEFKDIGAKKITEDMVSPTVKQTKEPEITYEPIKEVKPKQTTLDKVKFVLHKLGAKTEQEALELFQKKTSIKWTSFKDISEKRAEIGLKTLLNS